MPDTRPQKDKYIVLIINWAGNNSHWIKGFSSLKEAKAALRRIYDEHHEIANKAFIIRGDIEQIGVE
jgi:hypothetical protein